MAAITEPTAATQIRPAIRARDAARLSCANVAQAHDEEDGEDQRHQHPVRRDRKV